MGNSSAAFTDAILRAVQQQVRAIVKEEAEKSAQEVERRCMEVADSIALRVFSHYEIHTQADRLVIEVRKTDAIQRRE